MKYSVIAALLIATSAAVLAQPVATQAAPAASKAGSAMSEGEVRKVDKQAGKLTLRHGPLVNLDMPGMTMAFRVSDPKLLATLKEGDKIRFVAENVKGQLTVTRIEPAK